MNVIRYRDHTGEVRLAVKTDEGGVYCLPQRDLFALLHEARSCGQSPGEWIRNYLVGGDPALLVEEGLAFLVPVEAPEVWAAGVTYQRSREARNYEATGGKLDASTFYDKVYDAVRPELFLKSTAARTVGTGTEVRLRSDSDWQVPEPELGLVLDSEGTIVGYTIGNDMSCRDIEGENPLYLPQAKMWSRSCSIGPYVRLAEFVPDPYALDIGCRIFRDGQLCFDGSASTGQLKRKLEELVEFLKRDNDLFEGTVLLTGTCVVPPNEFTLAAGDRIEISITGLGTLVNVAAAGAGADAAVKL
ncbi:fumarylacetoacetate hydrolase family protein [Paenibacillus koleovorans]|uniref:fumarylacetoacetate hydrolase family protein n=1 Tax=Paenibacillus koleovorans TaxID=121608 RepID=UPI000FD88609|nr:fumarylacetoacetate hydrolase family protein [Paenibacillus koleovorans]